MPYIRVLLLPIRLHCSLASHFYVLCTSTLPGFLVKESPLYYAAYMILDQLQGLPQTSFSTGAHHNMHDAVKSTAAWQELQTTSFLSPDIIGSTILRPYPRLKDHQHGVSTGGTRP